MEDIHHFLAPSAVWEFPQMRIAVILALRVFSVRFVIMAGPANTL
jgi:nucleoside phosphorylase